MGASLLDRILEAEWQMFVRVRSARHAPCQSAPDNFKTIRSNLFETWTRPMLASYLADLEQAEAAGRNLLAEKYARMDKLIPPLSDSPLIDIIVTVESNWQEALERRYPALYRRCCRSMDETGDGRNFGIYLGCELETYGDRTLQLYFENIEAAVAANRNLAVEALHRLVCKNGYRDLDHAESVLKHGEMEWTPPTPRALTPSYPPRRSPAVIEGPPAPGAVGNSCGGGRWRGGPSRADGIEVPKVEDTEIFTGEPEGPK